MPYEVPCACGHTLVGRRRRRHQVVSCPACRRPVFILPRSPWPSSPRPSAVRKDILPGSLRSPRRPPSPWRMPLVAGACCAAAVLIVYLLILPRLSRPIPPADAERQSEADAAAAELHRALAAGERKLAEGSFTLARDEWNAALKLGDRRPDLLPAVRRRDVIQLQRQADLLARLLDLPLEEVLHQGALVRNRSEWQARFAVYRGKTVIFEDVVRRDGAGRPALASYVVEGPAEARVALEDLKLLNDLPLEPPQRLLFGARLAACAREDGGAWVIRFEPDSAVLLTDRTAAEACCPLPLGRDLLDVLARQQKWLHDGPEQVPAP